MDHMKLSSSTRSAEPKENSKSPASNASDRARLAMSIVRAVRHANKSDAIKTMTLVCGSRALPVVCARYSQ
jgi:hypothetical protein